MDLESVLDLIVAAEAEARQAWLTLTGPDSLHFDAQTCKTLDATLFDAKARVAKLRKQLLEQSTAGHFRDALKAA